MAPRGSARYPLAEQVVAPHTTLLDEWAVHYAPIDVEEDTVSYGSYDVTGIEGIAGYYIAHQTTDGDLCACSVPTSDGEKWSVRFDKAGAPTFTPGLTCPTCGIKGRIVRGRWVAHV